MQFWFSIRQSYRRAWSELEDSRFQNFGRGGAGALPLPSQQLRRHRAGLQPVSRVLVRSGAAVAGRRGGAAVPGPRARDRRARPAHVAQPGLVGKSRAECSRTETPRVCAVCRV